ncbi:MAG: isopentenyl-diphosphate Delta-isomerase [Bacteroidales bacterium]
MDKEFVVLVDEKDNDVGVMEKMEAHRKGVLHRAFSIFIFDDNHQMMIHKRALSKYHSPGLWTNACCSHPRKGESLAQATHRRLGEEMGFDCVLKEDFAFKYKADVGQGLIEHEYDHVFIGYFDGKPNINPDEVDSYAWVKIPELIKDIHDFPKKYTPWFKIAFAELVKRMKV